ncbi:MAG: hypothetical protein LBT53_00005 [Puniceicoccales bacterium]|nr:hypothetical protein [Puniceicoccales bacterium]
MARSILGHNLDSINEDGTIVPVPGEESRADESGHAAMALGEYYRATNEKFINRADIQQIVARCIAAQVALNANSENGLGYSAMALLAFGPSKERNGVWAHLADETRESLDKLLLHRSDYDTHFQAFNIAKAVTRFSLGLSRKDETNALLDRFVARIQANGTAQFCDDWPRNLEGRPDVLGGAYDLYGVMQFVFIRSALQLHANVHIRERKLPTLRTYAERYLKLLPDIVRADGLGWCYGRGIGAYGQMHAISLILQAMRDKWIAPDKIALYKDLVRRLFQFFFATYLDNEHGFLVIRDNERDTIPHHTTRMANFDAARYLCQWSRLAKTAGGTLEGNPPVVTRAAPRFHYFDKSSRKEQCLYIYQDPSTGLHIQIPLVSGGANGANTSDSLAFPHMPGVFDWPTNLYVPAFLPELTIGDNVFTPSFYGKNITNGIGLKNVYYFRYEQPELITKDEKIIPGVGSCKVEWEFFGSKITSKFTFQFRRQTQLNLLRYVLPIAAPHTRHRLGSSYTLGAESLRCTVPRDEFQAHWAETEVVSDDLNHRTYYGNLHYYQMLLRDRPHHLRPNHPYRLEVSFEPHIVTIDESNKSE